MSVAPEPAWGRIDAAHVFCEPKYTTSPHVAEFYNAASSLVYVAAGGTGLVLSRRWASDWRIQAGWAMLIAVGVGSVLFHATMRFSMELCDEIPMLFLVLAFLVGKEDCVGFMRGPAGRRRFRLAALALIALSTASYVALFVYEIFVYSFGLAVLFEIGLDLACRPKAWQTRACFAIAVACIAAGHAVWQAEQRLCARHPRVWPLHMVWHLLSCLGGVFAIVHNVFLRREKLQSTVCCAPLTCTDTGAKLRNTSAFTITQTQTQTQTQTHTTLQARCQCARPPPHLPSLDLSCDRCLTVPVPLPVPEVLWTRPRRVALTKSRRLKRSTFKRPINAEWMLASTLTDSCPSPVVVGMP